MKNYILPLDKLEIELELLNLILDKTARALNNNSRSIIMDIRLNKQIQKVNLENKYRNFQ